MFGKRGSVLAQARRASDEPLSPDRSLVCARDTNPSVDTRTAKTEVLPWGDACHDLSDDILAA
jgi:hypothetical protein